jgi:hypothetical protein
VASARGAKPAAVLHAPATAENVLRSLTAP